MNLTVARSKEVPSEDGDAEQPGGEGQREVTALGGGQGRRHPANLHHSSRSTLGRRRSGGVEPEAPLCPQRGSSALCLALHT